MSADDLLRLTARREDILDTLTGGPLSPRDVVDRVDLSRSTFNRAIRELDEAGLVDRSGGNCALTLSGRLVLDRYRACQRDLEGVVATEHALGPLDPDAPVDTAVLVDATVHLAEDSTPYQPEQRLHEVVRGADRYRAVLPALEDPRHLRLLYEHVVTDDRPAELLVPGELADSLADRFPRRLAAMAETDGFDLRTGDRPPFGLVLATDDDGPTVALAVFGDQGVHAVVVAETDRAADWAERTLEDYREGSTAVTEEFRQAPDGGVVLDTAVADGPALLADLERQGFVRLSRDFFAGRRVPDPTTAWRAGLDLAAVHTGYAVERSLTSGDGSVDDSPGDREDEPDGTLTERLIARLTAGEDCVVVGPPGAGKSTTCKRVATEWHADDRGPVLYRESGRGVDFSDVESLVATVEGTEGQALVVVEDAVRPEASAVFEVMERLGEGGEKGTPAVSFLLDAREREWRDPLDDVTVDRSALTIETMPPLSDRDYERLVEHFEATAGVEVDVSVDRLRERVRSSSGDAEAAPGELVSVLHRLETRADPLTEDATSLEEDAAALYETVADDGGTAADVAVAANLLNAAGLGVHPELLYAVAPDDPAAVEDAIDLLEGRVVFPREADRTGDAGTEPYPAVHEAWSAEFLAVFLDAAGEASARERFGRVLTRILAVADDADLRERIAGRLDGEAPYLGRVGEDPEGWVRESLDRLLEFGKQQPRLAPLFGTAETAAYELPTACPEPVQLDLIERRGRIQKNHGAYDAARAAYERLLERAQTADDRDYEATSLNSLGSVALRQGNYDDAREYFEESLAIYREIGSRRGEAKCLGNLGSVAHYRGEYDTARAYHEESLAIHREIGYRRGEAVRLNNLGTVAWRQGEYDAARNYLEESLTFYRESGDRRTEAKILTNLGLVARYRGESDAARAYFEESLATKREIGDRQGEANSHHNLGEVAKDEGEYDTAREYLEESLKICRTIGDRWGEATSLSSLGWVACNQGEYDAAREYFEESLAICRETGHQSGEAESLHGLGGVARDEGEYVVARECLETAIDILADLGEVPDELEAIEERVRVALDVDDHAAAVQWCDRGLERVEAADLDGLDDERATFEELHPER